MAAKTQPRAIYILYFVVFPVGLPPAEHEDNHYRQITPATTPEAAEPSPN